jgi:hypothetical protein
VETFRVDDLTERGAGIGIACAVCELPMTKEQLDMQTEFARDGDNPGPDTFHAHVRCFAAWNFERARRNS